MTTRPVATEDDLMTPAEVAALFHVDPKVPARWANQGKLRSVRTLGGHRRYYRAEVTALFAGNGGTPGDAA